MSNHGANQIGQYAVLAKYRVASVPNGNTTTQFNYGQGMIGLGTSAGVPMPGRFGRRGLFILANVGAFLPGLHHRDGTP